MPLAVTGGRKKEAPENRGNSKKVRKKVQAGAGRNTLGEKIEATGIFVKRKKDLNLARCQVVCIHKNVNDYPNIT